MKFTTEIYQGVREARGNPDQIKNEVHDAEILIVQIAPITADVIDSAKNLKVIFCSRGGPVNIDVKAAEKRGIIVTHSLGRLAQPVSDHTIGLLLAEVRNIARAHAAVKDGRYFKDMLRTWARPILEMEGRTLGLVGFGQVAREVAKRAKGFDLKLIAFDPYVSKKEMEKIGVVKVDLETLLRESDFVSVHARESPETFHMLGEKEFAIMKPTAILINTARGSIIDEEALVKALKNKVISGAALDVVEKEPLKPDNPLLSLDNLTITPHTAGGSDKAQVRSVRLVAVTVERYLKDKTIRPEEIVDPSKSLDS